MQRWCWCECHAPADEDRDEASTFYGVSMMDEVALHTAEDCCRGEHWREFYLATEPERPTPIEKVPWVDPPSSQADGWKDT